MIGVTVKKSGTWTPCWLCGTEQESVFDTHVEIGTGDGAFEQIELCIEHMDTLVSACLLRNKLELNNNNPEWYTKPDREVDDE